MLPMLAPQKILQNHARLDCPARPGTVHLYIATRKFLFWQAVPARGPVRTPRHVGPAADTMTEERMCVMASSQRRRQVRRERKAMYHVRARCVRRAYLCGQDRVTGKDYSHRKLWLLRRHEQLAGLFTIDVQFRAELSNHLHMAARTRPDVAQRLSQEDVARRWLTITRLAKCMDDSPLPLADVSILH